MRSGGGAWSGRRPCREETQQTLIYGENTNQLKSSRFFDLYFVFARPSLGCQPRSGACFAVVRRRLSCYTFKFSDSTRSTIAFQAWLNLPFSDLFGFEDISSLLPSSAVSLYFRAFTKRQALTVGSLGGSRSLCKGLRMSISPTQEKAAKILQVLEGDPLDINTPIAAFIQKECV